MEKIIQGGTLKLENGIMKYLPDDGGYMMYRCNDVSIFNYIESEREFVRELHYFYKLQGLKSQITNIKQFIHA